MVDWFKIAISPFVPPPLWYFLFTPTEAYYTPELPPPSPFYPPSPIPLPQETEQVNQPTQPAQDNKQDEQPKLPSPIPLFLIGAILIIIILSGKSD